MLVLLGYWWFIENQNQFFRFLFKWKEPTSFLDFINGVKQPHKMYNMVEWGNLPQKLSQYSLVDRNHGHLGWNLCKQCKHWFQHICSEFGSSGFTLAEYSSPILVYSSRMNVSGWSNKDLQFIVWTCGGLSAVQQAATSNSYFFLQLPIQLMHESLK